MSKNVDFQDVAARLRATHDDCKECDVCSYWCDLLTEETFTAGAIAGYGADLAAYVAGLPEEGPDRAKAIRAYAAQNPYLIETIRSCFLCNQCTYGCPGGLKTPTIMSTWREMLDAADVIHEADSKCVSVDAEWDLFKVYRRIQQTVFDGVMLDEAAAAGPGQADTLFFPGCTLASYAPELTQKVWDWLKEHSDGTVAMSDACCASPLISAGLKQRADDFCNGVVAQMQAADVRRVVFVCPGCEKRFLEYLPSDGSIQTVPLPQVLRAQGVSLTHPAVLSGVIGEVEDAASSDLSLAEPYAVYDSCNDRALRYGSAIRAMMGDTRRAEFAKSGPNARCCSAGGAVSSFKPPVCDARKNAVLEECRSDQADIGTIVTVCPTCASTFAQLLLQPADAEQAQLVADADVETRHYLELLFQEPIDWPQVFGNIMDMYTGQYAAWVYSVLF